MISRWCEAKWDVLPQKPGLDYIEKWHKAPPIHPCEAIGQYRDVGMGEEDGRSMAVPGRERSPCKRRGTPDAPVRECLSVSLRPFSPIDTDSATPRLSGRLRVSHTRTSMNMKNARDAKNDAMSYIYR